MVVKEQQRDPVRGSLTHLDLLEVKLDEEIEAEVPIELLGAEDAPGVKEGGVLEHVTHQVTISALPTAIPDAIPADVSGMSIGDTLQLSALIAPEGVEFAVDDPDELTIATLFAAAGRGGAGAGGRGGRGAGRRGGRGPRGRGGSRGGRGAAGGRVPRATGKGSSPAILVVGLGNPGSRYAATRHNLGFEVAAELTRRWQMPRAKERFRGLITEGRAGPGGPRVAVLIPQTYMNESGTSSGRPGGR